MPVYDYGCPRCGPFSAFRPMAEYAEPQDCPDCGEKAPRAQLSAPAIGGIATGWRVGMGGAGGQSRFSSDSGHGGGCGCCSGSLTRLPKQDWARKLS